MDLPASEPENAVPAKRTSTPKSPARPRSTRALLVEASPAHQAMLERCGTPHRPITVVHAATVAEARQYLANHVVDLAVLQPELPDGSGLDIAADLDRGSRTTATIVISSDADFAAAQHAIRAGADDFIVDGIDTSEMAQRVQHALDRKRRDKSHAQRVERLRRLCKKLNAARVEVSKQVDILCNDLVTAYQELACQMQNVVQTSEYANIIKDELDLETLLRKTLEHLMAKLGPSNAAIFLPSTMDEYSLGGYVNYDCTPESVDMLLQHLADTLAPRLAEQDEMVHMTDRNEIEHWIGEDAGQLADTGMIGLPCMCEDECLAILVLFRNRDQPFNEPHLDRVSSLGPMLGEALEKIIKVHHRSIFKAESYGPTEDFDGFDQDDWEDDDLPF